MNIIVINKANSERRPPVISVLYILNELGYKVHLITCDASTEFKAKMNKKSIEVIELPFYNHSSFLRKAIDFLLFKYYALKKIKQLSSKHTLLWIIDAPTIIALGKKLKSFRYILQIQELHEDSKFYLKNISKVIDHAEVVFMPEYNRTVLYQVWFKLKNRPKVLPNKPYFIPSELELVTLKNKYKKELSAFKGKKVILYQGGISKVRLLEKVAEAIAEMDEKFILLLVGKEQEPGYINQLKKITESIIHIPYLPAPDYLIFSTISYIGYVCYDPTSLNNAFCAPNKINEYSAFSLPMLGNDVPGLRTVFESTQAGVIIDTENIESIKKGIEEIDSNYSTYKTNSKNIYSLHDNFHTVESNLQKILKN